MRRNWTTRKGPPGEDDKGGGAGGAGGGAAGGAAGGGAGAGAATKPEGLDEKYWDATAGMKTPDLLKDLGDLAKYKTDAEAAKAALIADPAKIDWTIDVKGEDGAAFEINPEDPLFKAMAPQFVGMDQARVTNLVTNFAKAQAAGRDAMVKQITEEVKALGGGDHAKGVARIEATQNNFAAVLAGGSADAAAKEKALATAKGITASLNSVAQIEAIETLLTAARDPNAVRGGGGGDEKDPNKRASNFFERIAVKKAG